MVLCLVFLGYFVFVYIVVLNSFLDGVLGEGTGLGLVGFRVNFVFVIF